MDQLSSANYSTEELQRLVRSVTFFKDIAKLSPAQFDLILTVCRFVQASAGEAVMRKGDTANELFFLLKGQMSVSADDDTSLNLIHPGEVFGTLSMVTGRSRSATVKAESDVVLLSIDYKYFNDINDYSLVTLNTKLVAYRMLVHNIRWTLELNKMQDPTHELVPKLLKMPIYTGPKDSPEELASLHKQSCLLADLLCQWNESLIEAQPA